MKLQTKGKLYACAPAPAPSPILLNFRIFVVHFLCKYVCFKETIINIQIAFQLLYLLYIFHANGQHCIVDRNVH